jgi:hypothetical protein
MGRRDEQVSAKAKGKTIKLLRGSAGRVGQAVALSALLLCLTVVTGCEKQKENDDADHSTRQATPVTLDAGLSIWQAARVEPNADVVPFVQQAFEQGTAFDPSFFVPMQGEAASSLRYSLAEFRQTVGTDLRLTYADGLTFDSIADGPVLVPMADEDAEHLSLFNLAFAKEQAGLAYLLFDTADTNGISLRFHVLMALTDTSWKAMSITYFPHRAGNRDAEWALDNAQQQLADGDRLVGLALLSVAAQLSKTPPYRLSGLQTRLRSELGRPGLRPSDVPLETLSVSGGDVGITHVAAVVLSDGLYAEIHCRAERFEMEASMEQWQKEVARSAAAAHPGLSDVFDGIAVSSLFHDPAQQSKGFRSAFRFEALDLPVND